MIETLGLLTAFIIIILLRIRGVDFSLSIFLACIIIGVSSGEPLTLFIDAISKTVLDSSTWELCTAVALITVLGYSLKITGLMVELIQSLRSFLTSKALLALIPALFGILSMPGGALMSAPFLEEESERMSLKPEHKTFVNIWFRHVWYWVSPISTTTLILCNLTGLNLREFITINFPLFIASWIIGWFSMNQIIKENSIIIEKERNIIKSLKLSLPILITIILTLMNIPVWISVLVGVLTVYLLKKVSIGLGLKYIWYGIKWDTVMAVFATLFFRYFLTMSNSLANLFTTIIDFGFPLIILMILTPMLVGAISGTPTMGVGIIIPILLPLLTKISISNVTIIFAGVVSSYTLSPLHLCLILTNQYYKSNLKKVYKYLIPPVVILYVVAIAYHLIINF
ncbi:DUF401 family protein [Candidatus Bathyarchaeota archaeon]|nr:DUF401 family protein [Candidatus Bathyarchaeota archaeon]